MNNNTQKIIIHFSLIPHGIRCNFIMTLSKNYGCFQVIKHKRIFNYIINIIFVNRKEQKNEITFLYNSKTE